ncbi:MAG: HAD-IC family P-type ATPase [Gemmataceae bacterium]
MSTSVAGLTGAEVAERVAQGRVNRVRRSDAAEYLDIVARNVLTLFNALVVPAAAVLLLLGDYKAGLAVSGMMVANTLIGLIQEVRAKRQLDRLTLLAESRVRVVRDGQAAEVPAGDVVEGDYLLLAAGDPVVADGAVVESRFLEIDEALLTGESDPVPRKAGDPLLSGSFCVAGEGSYTAQRVGAAAFAQKTAAEARSYQYTASPLQEQIDRLIRILTATAVVMSLSYVALYLARGGISQDQLARMVAATITSMVPQGLVLMATLALLLGAVAMTGKGVVVNRLAAVEAMADIDTLCMDKTGTLTTNRLRLAQVRPLEGTDAESASRLLALFASTSLDRDNKSLLAFRSALGEEPGELLDQLPFKSQNRYSAVRVRRQAKEVALALGAFEALKPFLGDPQKAEAAWQELFPTGWRLLLFCEVEAAPGEKFAGSLDGCRLRPLALIALSDDLRPEAAGVLEQFAAQGVEFKILSGDNPETVRATVAPLAGESPSPALAALASNPVVTGAELEAAQVPHELVATRSVFGRVSPWQKVQIVRTLTALGRKVAMIGDGVNDVLPIKNAALGIAMGDGSRASKTVAGVVLQTNDFALLPQLLDEGRIIIRNLRRSAKLFLNKNVYFLLLVVGTLWVFHTKFPIDPQQVTLLNFLTIGVPALIITLDRRKADAARGDFVGEVGWFALWTGLITGVAGLLVSVVSARAWGDGVWMQHTMILTTLVLLGWVTLYRVAGEDRRLRFLPLAGAVVYLLVMYVPPVAGFFELEPLSAGRWGFVAVVAGAAAALMWVSDRLRGGSA